MCNLTEHKCHHFIMAMSSMPYERQILQQNHKAHRILPSWSFTEEYTKSVINTISNLILNMKMRSRPYDMCQVNRYNYYLQPIQIWNIENLSCVLTYKQTQTLRNNLSTGVQKHSETNTSPFMCKLSINIGDLVSCKIRSFNHCTTFQTK